MDQREKRELREHKRLLKRAGNQRLRRQWKREVAERPEDAPYLKEDYGRYRSAPLNGLDRAAPGGASPALGDGEGGR